MHNDNIVYSEEVSNLLRARGEFYHVSEKKCLDSIRRNGLCPKIATEIRQKNRGAEFYNYAHFGNRDVICYCTSSELKCIQDLFRRKDTVTFKINASSILSRSFDIDRSYSHPGLLQQSGDPQVDAYFAATMPEPIFYPDYPQLVEVDEFRRGLDLYGSVVCFEMIPYSELIEVPG